MFNTFYFYLDCVNKHEWFLCMCANNVCVAFNLYSFNMFNLYKKRELLKLAVPGVTILLTLLHKSKWVSQILNYFNNVLEVCFLT